MDFDYLNEPSVSGRVNNTTSKYKHFGIVYYLGEKYLLEDCGLVRKNYSTSEKANSN